MKRLLWTLILAILSYLVGLTIAMKHLETRLQQAEITAIDVIGEK